MDEIALSQKMQRLTRWLDDNSQPGSRMRHQFDGSPFGHCYLTIDPERQGDTASGNYNRIYLCGREAGMDAASIARWTGLFTQQGVKKFFVWLSPGPDMPAVRGWLEAAGLSRVPWVRYPTLLRDGNAPASF